MNLEDVAQKIAAGEIAAATCFHCGRNNPEYTSAYVPSPEVAKRLGQPEGNNGS